jgi:hypothetical protein
VADEPLDEMPDEVTVNLPELAGVIAELEQILRALHQASDDRWLADSVEAVIGRMTCWIWPRSANLTRTIGTMVEVEQTMSVAEAAERLGISVQDAYLLVFSKQLKSVEAPSGRRLIPVHVIEEWLRTHQVSA